MTKATFLFLLLLFCSQASPQSDWIEVPLPVNEPTLAVLSFADSSHGCICATDGTILLTTDNGSSWRIDSIPSPYSIDDCRVVSDSVIWAWGFQRLEDREWVIFRSSDQGQTWDQNGPPDTSQVLGTGFSSESLAWAATNTHMWATTDGGFSWTKRGELLGGGHINSFYGHGIEFFDDSIGFVEGGGGLATVDLGYQKTTDGGWTWVGWWAGPNPYPWCPDFVGGGPVRLVSDSVCTFWYWWIGPIQPGKFHGLVLSWNQLQDTVVVGPVHEFGVDPLKGFALDHENIWLLWNGNVRRTTDGGNSWVIDTLEITIDEILYDQDGHRLALGDGRLFRFNDPALEVKPQEVPPRSFGLHQNYPNPFNPSTTIRFELPRAGEVTLKIFNLLGEQVANLISGHQDAGTHTVRWDATGHPSGVYFYRLVAGESVETRKLVLVR